MSQLTVHVGPAHNLRQAAQQMAANGVGSAVVIDPDGQAPRLITERDIVNAVADGDDLDQQLVASRSRDEAIYASPDWSLSDAASQMATGRSRHLIVVENGEVVGLVSVRDIISVWAEEQGIKS